MGGPSTLFLADCRERVDSRLQTLFSGLSDSRLNRAMHYSVFNGGKRVRPALCYAAARAVAGANKGTDLAACALELIHAYSLVHDDLPAMDDDDLRRGKPTCHIAFDEATAILVGDGLQALAFRVLSESGSIEPRQSLELIRLLADAAGSEGMVAGQAIDLGAVDSLLSETQLEDMHKRKTGAMITASVLMGAVSTGSATDSQLQALRQYGDAVGLAFQVRDDILDVEADTARLGKRQGADRARNKPTYTSVLGLDGARRKLSALREAGIEALSGFGEAADDLRLMARYIIDRAF
jgi:geranylgeranyl pyrophosphate synthase